MLWWLLKQLRSDDRDIFLRAAEKAARTHEVRAVEPLLEALQHRNPWFREAAARALAGIGDPRAMPPLRLLLDDSDSLVREAVKMALAHLEGKPIPAPEAPLTATEEAPFVFEDDISAEEPPPVAVAEQPVVTEQQEALSTAARADDLVDVPPPAPPTPAPSTEESALSPAVEPCPEAEAPPAGPFEAAEAPAAATSELAPPAPKKRLASLQDAWLAVQSEGTSTPTPIRKTDTADELLRSVTSKTLLAGPTLARTVRPKTTTPPPAFSALDRIVQSQLVAAPQSPRERKADDSEEAGAALGVVSTLLSDSDRTVRRAAIKTLADMSSPQALPLLVGMVADPDSSVAAATADALIGYGRNAVEALMPLLDQPAEPVRAAAVAIVKRIDPDWQEPRATEQSPAPPPGDPAPTSSVPEPEPAAGERTTTDGAVAISAVTEAPSAGATTVESVAAREPEPPTIEAPAGEAASPASAVEGPPEPGPPLIEAPTTETAPPFASTETSEALSEEPSAVAAEPPPASPEPWTDVPLAAPLEADQRPRDDLAPISSAPKELILALASDDDSLRAATETVLDRVYPGWRRATLDPLVVDAVAAALHSPNGTVADAARRCLSSLSDPGAAEALRRADSA
jgi:HEAT repeat protein